MHSWDRLSVRGENVCSQAALCFVIRDFLFCTILLCKVHLVHLCSVFDELLSQKIDHDTGVQSRKLAFKSRGCPSCIMFPADTINNLKNDLTVPSWS